jgi:hypothetical protein
MDEGERNVLSERSVVLRQELKVWEREFAAGNGGMKAGREDIKQNSQIGMLIHSASMMYGLTVLRSSEIQRL